MSDYCYMLTYIMTLVFSFIGIYVGAALAFIAPEELKPGKQYFKGLQNAILAALIMIVLYRFGLNIYIVILLGILGSVTLYLLKDRDLLSQIAYFLMGFAFFFSTASNEFFALTASLIFLYGLPTGTLYACENPKKKKGTIIGDMTLAYGFFVVVALLSNLIYLLVLG